MTKITKRVVDAAHPKPGRRQLLWDNELKGFGLLLLPTGIKSYVFQYRTPEGRQRRLTIGQHGQWTPIEARKKAQEHRDAVRRGFDPLGEKRALREAPTVGEVLDDYLASERFAAKAASTRAIDTGRIERHLRPLLGKKFAHKLTEEDVRRSMRAITAGKTAARVKTKPRGVALVRGGPGTAKAGIDLLRTILNWAKVRPNPCDDIETGATGTRDAIIEDATAYARLFKTLGAMQSQLRIRPAAADAIRLIALTGCRRGEATGLRWCHVDLRQGRIVLPPLAHKTGKRTNKPRIIALPSVAQEIIARQPGGKPDELVFPPAKGKGSLQLSKVWRRKRKRKDGTVVEVGVAVEAELPKGLGLHGLRHSIGSHLAMGDAAEASIMAALGHQQSSTIRRYIHWVDNARSTLAERAAKVALAGLAAAGDADGGELIFAKVGKR